MDLFKTIPAYSMAIYLFLKLFKIVYNLLSTIQPILKIKIKNS